MQPRTIAELTSRAQANYVNLFIMYLKLLRVKVDLGTDHEFLALMENVARCQGLVEYLKLVPYDLQKYRFRFPAEVCDRYAISVANIWERLDGKPREEFFDAVLEFAN